MSWFKVPWDQIEKYLEQNSESVFQSMFSSMDTIENEVQGLVDKDLDLYRDKVADQIITGAARSTMLIGGGAALPDLLPIGWPAMIGSIGADFVLTLKTDGNMLLKLSYLYGRELTREERKREALGFLSLAGDGKVEEGASVEAASLLGLIGTKHISKKVLVEVGKKLGLRFYQKKLVALIPGLGILLSGGVNYYSTKKIGEYAKAFYMRRTSQGGTASPVVAMDAFQHCYLQVLVNVAKVDKVVSRDELGILKDSLLMFGLGDREQRHMLGQLDDLEELRPLDEAQVKSLSREDRRFILKQALVMAYADKKKSPQEASYLEVLSKKLELPQELFEDIEREVLREQGL